MEECASSANHQVVGSWGGQSCHSSLNFSLHDWFDSIVRLKADLLNDLRNLITFRIADEVNDVLIILDQADDFAHALLLHLIAIPGELEGGVKALLNCASLEIDHMAIALANSSIDAAEVNDLVGAPWGHQWHTASWNGVASGEFDDFPSG